MRRFPRFISSFCVPLCAAFIACAFSSPRAAAASENEFVPVTDAMLQQPDAADWLSFRRTTASWGFSPLTQLDKSNVKQLTLVWSRPMGDGIQEATPLVYRGVMYLPNPNDLTQAIDAATGELRWEYRRTMPDDLEEHVGYPSINRNLAIFGNLVIDTSSDDYLYALDATSGKLVWETKQLDYRQAPATQSSGPIVANGKVVSGRSCRPNRGPEACVVMAHDARTGKELWRTTTIDPKEDANDSWGGFPHAKRSHVGSWYPPSYDPESNLILIGTSVTWPAPKFIFGDNERQYLFHNSTLALNADTGKMVWHYQHVVDHWDMDHVYERIVDEVEVAPDPKAVAWINPKLRAGERRKVVTGIPGKTGIVYTLDSKTGEFLWATPTVSQNVVKDIDVRTGGVTVNPEVKYNNVGDTNQVCPSSMGGKNWPSGTYNPDSKVMFYPLLNTCMQVIAITDDPDTPESYGLLREHAIAPGTENLGTIYAISAETGRVIWKHEQRTGVMSLVATGGGLLFGGDVTGRFFAIDQDTGQILWKTNLGSPVTGFPISFSVDGRQFIAVSTGNAPLGGQELVLTPEVRPGDANQMFVFALPEEENP